MFVFNQFGNLIPSNTPILCTFENLLESFAWNEHRRLLLAELQSFISDVKNLISADTKIWVDGSFVTNKILPNDIDLVLFVNTSVYQDNYNLFKQIRGKFSNIDAYFVEVFPEDHKKYQHSELDKLEFLHLFSKDRKRRNKGFIELKIN